MALSQKQTGNAQAPREKNDLQFYISRLVKSILYLEKQLEIKVRDAFKALAGDDKKRITEIM